MAASWGRDFSGTPAFVRMAWSVSLCRDEKSEGREAGPDHFKVKRASSRPLL